MTLPDARKRLFAVPSKQYWPSLKTPLGKAAWVMLTIAVVNFIAFAVIAAFLGGDALNGKIEAGHYFLNNHGRYTEVSQAVFTYSAWHARSMFATHLTTIAIWGFAIWRRA